jgi:citrate lyase subunit beta/citryl-CoA lyase
MIPLPLRHLLFAPADSERKMTRAAASDAYMVIFDLEDSVAPERKAEARQLVAAALTARGTRRVAVRINAADTPEHLPDLSAVVPGAPDCIMLPKCGGPAETLILGHQLAALECAAGVPVGSIGILPLVTETAAALATLDYRDASARLVALAFAGEDLASDLGVEARTDGGLNPLLAAARTRVAIAAAAAGLPAIDTPFPDPRDAQRLAREAAEAARLGFAGKLCIHPDQIAPVTLAFTPSRERLAWAEAVVVALDQDDSPGVALVMGRMADKAHLRLARRVVAGARP